MKRGTIWFRHTNHGETLPSAGRSTWWARSAKPATASLPSACCRPLHPAAQLPGLPDIGLLAAAAVALVLAMLPVFRQVRLPDRGAGRRRIEQASGLAHRPLTALEDRMSGSGEDLASVALWQAHRDR